MTSKKQSKKTDQEIFTSICSCIKNDMYPEQIAEFLSKKTSKKWSKQRVHYWISRLKKEGYIRKILRTSFTKYALSDKSKKFLAQCETPNYDEHNLIVSYDLKNVGRLPEGGIDMNNWKYARMEFGNFEVRVHYGKVSKVKIYPPTTYGNNSIETSFDCGVIVERILEFLKRHYRCEIDYSTRTVDRDPHFHPLKDPVLKGFEQSGLDYSSDIMQVNGSGHAGGDILKDGINGYETMIREFPTLKESLGSIAMNQTRILNLHAISTEALSKISKTLEFMANRPARKVKKIITRPLNWWLR